MLGRKRRFTRRTLAKDSFVNHYHNEHSKNLIQRTWHHCTAQTQDTRIEVTNSLPR